MRLRFLLGSPLFPAPTRFLWRKTTFPTSPIQKPSLLGLLPKTFPRPYITQIPLQIPTPEPHSPAAGNREAANDPFLAQAEPPQEFDIPDSFQAEDPIDLQGLKKKAAEEKEAGLISEETLKKLEELDEEEAEQRRSFKRIGGTISGVKVAKFGGIRDMKIKRWFTTAAASEVLENGKWTLALDDRVLVTRNEKQFFLPNKKMALAIASEWEAIDGLVGLSLLPLTSQACRAIDDMPQFREYYHDEILDFLEGDHVCFRDEDSPRDFAKQKEIHQPIVDWFENFYGLKLGISLNCNIQEHPKKTVDTISLYLKSLDDFHFHLFHTVTHATKSVVTALALWNNAITVDHAISSVLLEEELNINSHGFVEGAHDLKKIQTCVDVYCSAVLIQLGEVPPPTKETFQNLGEDPSQILEQMEKDRDERFRKLDEQMAKRFKEALKEEIAKDGKNKEALQFFLDTYDKAQAEKETEKKKDE